MTFLKFLFSRTFLIQLVLAVLALILLAFIVLEWLEFSTNQDQEISVPDLQSLALDEVDERLAELDLRREILDSANYNPDYPPYTVIDQVPRAGKKVKENRKIYLTLNPSGFRKVEIPENLIRRTRRSWKVRIMNFDKKAQEPEENEDELYEHHRFVADKGQQPLRVDKYLMNYIENATRNKIQTAAKDGNIYVNDIPVKSNYKVKPGDVVQVMFEHPPYDFLLTPENIVVKGRVWCIGLIRIQVAFLSLHGQSRR